jgi:hypothetical protein
LPRVLEGLVQKTIWPGHAVATPHPAADLTRVSYRVSLVAGGVAG